MPSVMFNSAPTEKPISFLAKAWQYLQPKNSKDTEEAEVYRKPNDSLFPNEIYQELSKPCGFDAESTLSKSLNRNKPTAINNSFTSPRSSIKKYRYPWTKQLNTENTQKPLHKAEQQSALEQDVDIHESGLFTVELIKHPNGYLGIVLVGGIDTPLQNHYVNSILPSSSASKSGCVKIGDELLEVNGHNLRQATHAEALRIFRCLPSVVKLVISRSEDANRSVLQLAKESTPAKKNNNLSSQEGDLDKPKSAFQAAADTSVVPKSVSSVVDVTKRTGSGLSDVQRLSRCSSFFGSSEDVKGAQAKQSEESNASEGKYNPEACSKNGEEENPATSDKRGGSFIEDDDLDNTTWLTRRNTICGYRSSLQTLNEGNSSPYSAGPFIRDAPERHSTFSSTSRTWPTLKQRTLFSWEQTKHVTMKRRGASARLQSRAAVTSSNSSLHQTATTKIFGTPSGKNCQIEKETLSVQICKGDGESDWGFTVGGGLMSPYGDLSIYIVEVSEDGPVHGILKRGDEIVEFNGDSFGNITLLEAERNLGMSAMDVTVTIKRKFLQRTGSMREQSNPYADTWTK